MPEFKNIVERAEAFYMDWECACNLCEDEMGGHIHGPWVANWMRLQGWTQADVDMREDLFLVRSMAKGLADLAARGTHHDTNPTRKTVALDPVWAETDRWWLSYFQSADRAVRRRAELALRTDG